MKERTKLALIVAAFAAAWFLPVGSERFWSAVRESLSLVKWYAQEHVLLCLVPAFFIAGAISVFVSQGAVMKYLGPKAKKVVAYPVAAVSGTILAICSCTVLPLLLGGVLVAGFLLGGPSGSERGLIPNSWIAQSVGGNRGDVFWSSVLTLTRRRRAMKIEVLGTGCPKCKKLYAEAEKAIAASGVPAELEKVEKIEEIMKFSVMMTPALVIDGEVKASGRIPSCAEIVSWITAAASAKEKA